MNIRQVRKKVKSITNVKKITKAMELVAGIKMRKAQTLELTGRPYRTYLENILKKISPDIDSHTSSLIADQQEKEVRRELAILISSNKGLCGFFHVNILRFLIKNIDFKKTDFITVGKKGSIMVNHMGSTIVADYSFGNAMSEVSAIFNLASSLYLENKYDGVKLIYTRYISTLRSVVVCVPVLPFQIDSSESVKNNGNYLIEPSADEIIETIIKDYLEDKILGAIISSEAVEHAARMMAMRNATENADHVIENLTLLGNKLRQEKITYELLDMVTAKESVEGS